MNGQPTGESVATCCRFSVWDGSPLDGEVCPCGHRITPGYRCHNCGRTKFERARLIDGHADG